MPSTDNSLGDIRSAEPPSPSMRWDGKRDANSKEALLIIFLSLLGAIVLSTVWCVCSRMREASNQAGIQDVHDTGSTSPSARSDRADETDTNSNESNETDTNSNESNESNDSNESNETDTNSNGSVKSHRCPGLSGSGRVGIIVHNPDGAIQIGLGPSESAGKLASATCLKEFAAARM
jgi:hypothetical protein